MLDEIIHHHMREVCKELLDVILESSDTGPPKALALQRAVELLEGDVPNDKLILSQQLVILINQKIYHTYKFVIKCVIDNPVLNHNPVIVYLIFLCKTMGSTCKSV